MIQFLVVTDASGVIQQVKWCDPVYLISPHTKSLLELFCSDQHDSLRGTLKKCLQEKHTNPDTQSFQLVDSVKQIHLSMLPVDSVVLVFGSQVLNEQNIKIQQLKSIIHRFMREVGDHAQKKEILQTESSRSQFEHIQALNNELINTKRMVDKANAQLSVLNESLNNRLVKDALTGLISRYQYREEIQLRLNEQPGKMGVFMFIDIDSFKLINDTYGHGVGDEYLIAFSQRLQKLPIQNDVKMRIAGDEFGLFTCGLSQVNETEMEQMWELIQNRVLNRPIRTSAGLLPISVSVGMAVYGQDTDNIHELIDYADFAMYQAKRKGKNRFDYFRKEEYIQERTSSHGERSLNEAGRLMDGYHL